MDKIITYNSSAYHDTEFEVVSIEPLTGRNRSETAIKFLTEKGIDGFVNLKLGRSEFWAYHYSDGRAGTAFKKPRKNTRSA